MRPILLSALALLAVARPVSADSFSPAQREEIVRIVRDALRNKEVEARRQIIESTNL